MPVSIVHVGCGVVACAVAACSYNTVSRRAFTSSLSPVQLQAYRRIARGRMCTALVAVMAGGAAAWFAASHGADRCQAAAGAVAVAYTTYRMWPREEWMLSHLTSVEQVRLWKDMYVSMAAISHLSMLIAFAGYFLLSREACRARACPDGAD